MLVGGIQDIKKKREEGGGGRRKRNEGEVRAGKKPRSERGLDTREGEAREKEERSEMLACLPAA